MKTPQEYREKVNKQKTIKLPSGFEVVIRGMPSLKLLEFTTKAAQEGVGFEDYLNSNLLEVLTTVIPSSVVRPTILPPDPDGIRKENTLFLDELNVIDLMSLLQEITDLSGLDQEKLEGFENFPAKRDGKGSGDSSKGIRV